MYMYMQLSDTSYFLLDCHKMTALCNNASAAKCKGTLPLQHIQTHHDFSTADSVGLTDAGYSSHLSISSLSQFFCCCHTRSGTLFCFVLFCFCSRGCVFAYDQSQFVFAYNKSIITTVECNTQQISLVHCLQYCLLVLCTRKHYLQ